MCIGSHPDNLFKMFVQRDILEQCGMAMGNQCFSSSLGLEGWAAKEWSAITYTRVTNAAMHKAKAHGLMRETVGKEVEEDKWQCFEETLQQGDMDTKEDLEYLKELIQDIA